MPLGFRAGYFSITHNVFYPFKNKCYHNYEDHFNLQSSVNSLKMNGSKISKLVENTVGKGEVACYEQFPLSHTMFSKDFYYRLIKIRACLEKAFKYYHNYKN